MNLPNFLRHHVVAAILLTAGAVSVLWILWFIGATHYQSVVEDWIKIGREQGYEISYDRREQFGFPRHTVLRYTNVHWKNTDGFEFHANDLDISAELWATRDFKVKFKGQVELDVPTNTAHEILVLAGESGHVDVKLTEDGSWQNCKIAMKTARLGRSPDYLFLADDIQLTAQRPAKDPDDTKTAGLTLGAEASDITLPTATPPSFGSKMPKVAINLRLMGPVPDFRKKSSVEAWNKMNGLVEFDRLNMEWGPLLLKSRGAMNFDDDLQPEGAFSATIAKPEEVLDVLAKQGYIAAAQQEMMHSALKFLAKPSPIGGESGIEVPIAVQLGSFFFGPVRIFAFPPIEWE